MEKKEPFLWTCSTNQANPPRVVARRLTGAHPWDCDKGKEKVSLLDLGRGSPCTLLYGIAASCIAFFLHSSTQASPAFRAIPPPPQHPSPSAHHNPTQPGPDPSSTAAPQPFVPFYPLGRNSDACPSLPPPCPERREVGKGKVSPALCRNVQVCQKTKPVPFATHQLLLPQKRGEEGGRERGGHFVTRKGKP